jgi:glycosyltransferase involved in cell wall biosynthesis
LNNTKIFFLVGSLKLGGTEKVALTIGQFLAKRGIEVWFVSLTDKQDFVVDKNRHVVLLATKPKGFVRTAWRAWKNLFMLIRKERPSVVVSFSVGLNLFLFTQFFSRTVFVIDTNIFAFVKKWYYKHLLKYFIYFPHVRAVAIPSRGLLGACKDFFGNERKLVLINNPVDLDLIEKLKVVPLDEEYLDKSPFIVAAGRINKLKGFAGIVRAYASSSLVARWKLVILGYGPEEDAIKHLIKELGLENSVYMLGFKQNPYQYFHRSGIFILNSKMESFGNVLIEALACDCAILSSDCDFGPRDIVIKGVNGDLFEFNNESELTSKMESVLDDWNRHDHLRAGAQQSVLQFDLSVIGPQWEKMLLDAAGARTSNA